MVLTPETWVRFGVWMAIGILEKYFQFKFMLFNFVIALKALLFIFYMVRDIV